MLGVAYALWHLGPRGKEESHSRNGKPIEGGGDGGARVGERGASRERKEGGALR